MICLNDICVFTAGSFTFFAIFWFDILQDIYRKNSYLAIMEQFLRSIESKTKIIVINNPNFTRISIPETISIRECFPVKLLLRVLKRRWKYRDVFSMMKETRRNLIQRSRRNTDCAAFEITCTLSSMVMFNESV